MLVVPAVLDVSEDWKSIVGAPIPEGVNATGILPEGYSVGE